MDIAPISSFDLRLDPVQLQRDPERLESAFDALLLRMLTGEGGLLGLGAQEAGGETLMGALNEVLLESLAQSLRLGFGRALLAQQTGGNHE